MASSHQDPFATGEHALICQHLHHTRLRYNTAVFRCFVFCPSLYAWLLIKGPVC